MNLREVAVSPFTSLAGFEILARLTGSRTNLQMLSHVGPHRSPLIPPNLSYSLRIWDKSTENPWRVKTTSLDNLNFGVETGPEMKSVRLRQKYWSCGRCRT